MRQLIQRICIASITMLCVGCVVSTGLAAKVNGLEKRQIQLEAEFQRQQIESSCKNKEVLSFLKDCKELLRSGDETTCSTRNVQQTMRSMTDQVHVLVRLRPGHPVERMSQSKRSQLHNRLGPSALKTISSVVIVTRPQSNSPEHFNESSSLGRNIKRYLIEQVGVPADKLYGPLPISCRPKQDMLDVFASKNPEDKPDFDEPAKGESQVGIWVFRLDCGNVDASLLDTGTRSTSG